MKPIHVKNVSKSYSYFEKTPGFKGAVKDLFRRETKIKNAVNDVSFSIDEGEFVGLIGTNGAGKTTLIKMLTGIIQPTKGEISINGFNPAEGADAFKKSFAVVMGQKSQLWWDLPASDSLLLNKVIYDIPEKLYLENVHYFTELFAVETLLSVPVRKLSLGERMKFELIASLLHMPKLLLLDEPTIGLDVVAQRQIREMLKTAGKERGISLLLTSHYTEDLLDLTERSLVLRDGALIYDGLLQPLLARYQVESTLELIFSEKPSLPALSNVEIIEQTGYAVKIKTPKENISRCLALIFKKTEVLDIKISEEDVSTLVERMFQSDEKIS
ncbi:ABC transporter ATP-binding protein [Enterococcus sp. LJL128]|uniref:ABC transporter ATP-binding protein n=1 Tax=Enterococcus sp. LJL51 TaxID=3416656 RepID=UPI003CEBAEDA